VLNAPTVKQLLWLTETKNSDELEANWKLIVDALAARKIDSPANLVAVAGTVIVETASTFRPIKEFGTPDYFKRMYWDNVKVRNELGNILPSDAYDFCGHGFIQITGRKNTERAGLAIGVDLLNNPDAALDPNNAAKILAWYWEQHGLQDLCDKAYKQAYLAKNYMEALDGWELVRETVNGGLNGWSSFRDILCILGAIQCCQ